MNKIINKEFKVGELYRGVVNGRKFSVTGIDETHDSIVFTDEKGHKSVYGLQAAKRLFIQRVQNSTL